MLRDVNYADNSCFLAVTFNDMKDKIKRLSEIEKKDPGI